MRDRQPDLYLRTSAAERLQLKHIVGVLAFLAVLYVAGSAFLSIVRSL